jgi:hypothetical protein
VVVDEPHDVDAVLRVLEHLARDELTDVSGPDNDHVLDVQNALARGGPHRRSTGRDQNDREDPEARELRERRRRRTGQPSAEQQQPGPDGHEVEDADEVVHRGVVGAFLVAVIEPVHLRHHQPHRQRGQERDPLPGLRGVRQERLGQREGAQQSDEIRNDEKPSDQPAAPADAVVAATSSDDVQGARVDVVEEALRVRHVGSRRCRVARMRVDENGPCMCRASVAIDRSCEVGVADLRTRAGHPAPPGR